MDTIIPLQFTNHVHQPVYRPETNMTTCTQCGLVLKWGV